MALSWRACPLKFCRNQTEKIELHFASFHARFFSANKSIVNQEMECGKRSVALACVASFALIDNDVVWSKIIEKKLRPRTAIKQKDAQCAPSAGRHESIKHVAAAAATQLKTHFSAQESSCVSHTCSPSTRYNFEQRFKILDKYFVRKKHVSLIIL